MAKRGRPTKYKPEYVDAVYKYIDECIKTDKKNKLLPTDEGLGICLGVVVNTLKNWAGEHPEFLIALKMLQMYQKRELINRGLLSTYNSTICKLILSSNHGMKERSDVTTNDRPIQQSLSVEEMKERIKQADSAGTGIDFRSIEGNGGGTNGGGSTTE